MRDNGTSMLADLLSEQKLLKWTDQPVIERFTQDGLIVASFEYAAIVASFFYEKGVFRPFLQCFSHLYWWYRQNDQVLYSYECYYTRKLRCFCKGTSTIFKWYLGWKCMLYERRNHMIDLDTEMCNNVFVIDVFLYDTWVTSSETVIEYTCKLWINLCITQQNLHHPHPAGTWRKTVIVLTSMWRRIDFDTTSVCTKCPPDINLIFYPTKGEYWLYCVDAQAKSLLFTRI